MAKPAKCITVTEAKKLQKRWSDTRAKDIESAEGFKDACEFTFNIDELQEYIDYVKEEAEKQQIKKPGLRLFFAAYNDSKSKKATIFLCPTESDSKNADNIYTIDPFNRSNGGWPPKSY